MHDSDDDKNGKHLNGSGTNGFSGSNGSDDKNIVKFPSLVERDRARKEKLLQEEAHRKAYNARQKSQKTPFLNLDKIPPFIRVITPLLIGIYAVQSLLLTAPQSFWLVYNLGVVPSRFLDLSEPLAALTPLTYMFVHGGWMHAGMNALMMAALGAAFERDFGTRRSVQFFVICGFAGAMMHIVLHYGADVPLIGASGAVSGYFSSFLLMAYWRGALPPMGRFAKYGIWPFIGVWAFLIVGIGMLLGGSSLSWEAHLAGFVVGLFLTSYWARRRWKFWV